MPSVSADDLSNLLNIAGAVTDTILEAMIDGAIDRLNRYGTSISNMSGTAGSKTVSLTSAQRGAVLEVASAIYSISKSSGSSSTSLSIGGLSTSESSAQGNTIFESMVKEAARQLLLEDAEYGTAFLR